MASTQNLLTSKEIKGLSKLGFKFTNPLGTPGFLYFSLRVPDGPWWGTKWRGYIYSSGDGLDSELYFTEAHPHPHIWIRRDGCHLCADGLKDWRPVTLLQAFWTLLHVVDLDDAYQLKRCVRSMIQGLERAQSVTPDLVAEYQFIYSALKRCNENDEAIPVYKQLLTEARVN